MDRTLNQYNSHPEVLAYREPAAKRARSASGAAKRCDDDAKGIQVSRRVRTAIFNLLVRSCSDAHLLMRAHFQQRLFRNSAFSEEILAMPALWVGHQLPVVPMKSDAVPPAMEDSVIISWSAPLPEEGHVFMIRRIIRDFERKADADASTPEASEANAMRCERGHGAPLHCTGVGPGEALLEVRPPRGRLQGLL